MFSKRNEKNVNIDSLFGENIKFSGKVEGKGNLRVDGVIEGDIDYEGDVIIGETGRIKGNILCHNTSLAGTVEGNIKAKGKLTIHPTGKLMGDAEISKLIVHEGALFEGNCKMGVKKASQEAKADDKPNGKPNSKKVEKAKE